MKAKEVADEKEIISLLEQAKISFSNNEEELTRRIEWIVSLCEEKYRDEVEKEKNIYNLISFLLIASSFLVPAFVSYLIAFFDSKLHEIMDYKVVLTIITGTFLLLSIGLELFLVIYRKRSRLKSVLSTAKDYLSKDVSFEHQYSENYGRILLLNDYIQSCEKNNRILSILEIVAVIVLSLFLVLFFACFVVF